MTKMFKTQERESLKSLAKRRGFKSARDYVRALVRQDAKQHGETVDLEDEDELDDPFESFKRGWDDAMNGRVMSYEEFHRRMTTDAE